FRRQRRQRRFGAKWVSIGSASRARELGSARLGRHTAVSPPLAVLRPELLSFRPSESFGAPHKNAATAPGFHSVLFGYSETPFIEEPGVTPAPGTGGHALALKNGRD